jgi:tetratricopeptide (TPR) repeat protein
MLERLGGEAGKWERHGSPLRLLTGGPESVSSRQQTLSNAIAWSYDLLGDDEKVLFRRLGVFAGGCTLEAAEQVCGVWNGDEQHSPHLIDLLESLVDRSLVRQEGLGGEPRFWMLETIREYALDRLEESEEGTEVRARHAEYFCEMTQAAEPGLQSEGQSAWLARLEREHDNIRAALRFSLESGRIETAARTGASLRRFWYLHGHMSEGRKWLDEVLRAGGLPRELRARVLHALGTLAWSLGDYDRAQEVFEEGLEIFRALDDRRGVANMLHNMGVVALPQGRDAAAHALHEESLEIFRSLGDRWSIALSLANLGLVALNGGEYGRAHSLLEESLAIRRELGEQQSVAQSLNNLGIVVRCEGDYRGAYSLHEEGLAIFRALGDEWSICQSLNNLGLAALGQGEYEVAASHFEGALRLAQKLGARQVVPTALEGLAGVTAQEGRGEAGVLFGAAEALRETIGAPLPSSERADYERSLAVARGALGEEELVRSWARGRVMSQAEAVRLAQAISPGAAKR